MQALTHVPKWSGQDHFCATEDMGCQPGISSPGLGMTNWLLYPLVYNSECKLISHDLAYFSPQRLWDMLLPTALTCVFLCPHFGCLWLQNSLFWTGFSQDKPKQKLLCPRNTFSSAMGCSPGEGRETSFAGGTWRKKGHPFSILTPFVIEANNWHLFS